MGLPYLKTMHHQTLYTNFPATGGAHMTTRVGQTGCRVEATRMAAGVMHTVGITREPLRNIRPSERLGLSILRPRVIADNTGINARKSSIKLFA